MTFTARHVTFFALDLNIRKIVSGCSALLWQSGTFNNIFYSTQQLCSNVTQFRSAISQGSDEITFIAMGASAVARWHQKVAALCCHQK